MNSFNFTKKEFMNLENRVIVLIEQDDIKKKFYFQSGGHLIYGSKPHL